MSHITDRRFPGYFLTDTPTVLHKDLPSLLHEFHQLWWRRDVSMRWLETAIRNAYCVGIIHAETGTRVGYARSITDYCGFARLTDVYVLPEHRRKGLGGWLLRWITRESKMKDVEKIELVCLDKEIPMYKELGFCLCEATDLKYMQILRSKCESDGNLPTLDS